MTPEQRANRIKKLYQILHRQLKKAARENILIEFEHKGWTRDIPYWELGEIIISKDLAS